MTPGGVGPAPGQTSGGSQASSGSNAKWWWWGGGAAALAGLGTFIGFRKLSQNKQAQIQEQAKQASQKPPSQPSPPPTEPQPPPAAKPESPAEKKPEAVDTGGPTHTSNESPTRAVGGEAQAPSEADEKFLANLRAELPKIKYDPEKATQQWLEIDAPVRARFLKAMCCDRAELKYLAEELGLSDQASQEKLGQEGPLTPQHFRVLLECAVIYNALQKHLPPRAQFLGLSDFQADIRIDGQKMPPHGEALKFCTQLDDGRAEELVRKQMGGSAARGWSKRDESDKRRLYLESLGRAAHCRYKAEIDALCFKKMKHDIDWEGANPVVAWVRWHTPWARRRVEREFLDVRATHHKVTGRYFGDPDARKASTRRNFGSFGFNRSQWREEHPTAVTAAKFGAVVAAGGALLYGIRYWMNEAA